MPHWNGRACTGSSAYLPGGHGGGVLGYTVGLSAMKWLGFTGFGPGEHRAAGGGRFHGVSLRGGMWPSGWVGALACAGAVAPGAKREVAKDVAVGRKAARERRWWWCEERTESEEHHPEPVQIIEPVLVDAPKRRVVKERQSPVHRHA